MARHKDAQWNLDDSLTWDGVKVAVLMDLRDELKALNATLGCWRFQRMADAMIEMNRKVKGRRITTREAARVLAKRRNRKAKP